MAKNVDQYRQNFLMKITNAERELVQLGLPGPDKIVIWYVRSRKDLNPIEGPLPTVAINGQSVHTSNITHHTIPREVGTGRIEILSLAPATRYEVRVQLSAMGRHHVLFAHTAPDGTDPVAFSFLSFSCFSPFEDEIVRRRTVRILALMRHRARARAFGRRDSGELTFTGPSFAFGSGDQIYVDREAKPIQFSGGEQDLLSGGTSKTRLYPNGKANAFFDILYRNYFAIPPYDEMLSHLPTCMMWDDHDIRDGWGSHGDEEEKAWNDHYIAARKWFLGYQALRNPYPAGRAVPLDQVEQHALSGPASPMMPELFYSFEWGSLATCFAMDLRSQRFAGKKQNGDYPDARVISREQEDAFTAWLSDKQWHAKPKLFVLVTSMPLTHAQGTNFQEWRLWFRKDDRLDNWWSRACLPTRNRLISKIVRHFRAEDKHRLLVLSGDVHFSELLELSLMRNGKEIVFGHEVVSSGLAQAHFYAKTGDRPHAQSKECIGDNEEYLNAKGIERLLAPSFAELFVKPPTGESPPDLSVCFYPAARVEGSELANSPTEVARTGIPSFPLPLRPIKSTTNFMKRFIVSDSAAIPWDESSASWEED